ncbi:DNA mismatch repair protein Mlh3 [Caerostris extrusa]|uniref:DNA mismatch repair protein Mlh3 n=1 Tax=Caerostris extrusa TaxID=172846 RepID=A0AAV4NNF5_CAEEX|nr:DNA mismatch repair protein Mlh3 [Caerostris extrusa]
MVYIRESGNRTDTDRGNKKSHAEKLKWFKDTSNMHRQIKKIIKEWLDSLMQTRSVSSILPKTFSAVLNSQACRGAVKFGDPLELSQCEDLLSALSKCKLPFQCAHGRPSIAPVLDLNKIETLSKKRDLPKLWKLKELFENHPCNR